MGCQIASQGSPEEMGPEDPPLQPFTLGCSLVTLTHSSSSFPPPLPRDDSAEVDVYNPTKNEWDKIPSMNQVSLQTRQQWEHKLVLVSNQSVSRSLGCSPGGQGPVSGPFLVLPS